MGWQYFLACANNITASGGTISAPTVNATTRVTVNGAIGPLNALALSTLVNLLNLPACTAGQVLTKTGQTTFACISAAATDPAADDAAAAGNADTGTTASNNQVTPPPPPGECGPASIQVAGGIPMWSTCPAQYLCGSGSVPSAITIINNDPYFGVLPVWGWTCTNPASGPTQTVGCMAGGAPISGSNIVNVDYGTCLTTPRSGCYGVNSTLPTCE